MGEWPRRRWVIAAVVAVGSAIAMGVPTGVLRTNLYHRMTPVQWWNYPVWALSAVLVGLLVATYVRSQPGGGAAPVTGGLLSTFAIGCPICNKLVVAALGVSGALNVWAPIQPWLGVSSVALLAYALRRRIAGEQACPVPAAADARAGVRSSADGSGYEPS